MLCRPAGACEANPIGTHHPTCSGLGQSRGISTCVGKFRPQLKRRIELETCKESQSGLRTSLVEGDTPPLIYRIHLLLICFIGRFNETLPYDLISGTDISVPVRQEDNIQVRYLQLFRSSETVLATRRTTLPQPRAEYIDTPSGK